MTACHAIMGPLLHRATSGEGQVVTTSLLEATTAFVRESAARHLNAAPGEEAGGSVETGDKPWRRCTWPPAAMDCPL